MEQNLRTISGEVADVFAHRFVVTTKDGNVLADLGPKGAERVALKVGDKVEVTGETKPSGMKVSKITRQGREPIELGHGPKTDEHEGDVDPSAALRTVERDGFTVVGEPRRKPKHFEITGRDAAGKALELHVAFDGTIRRSRPVTSETA